MREIPSVLSRRSTLEPMNSELEMSLLKPISVNFEANHPSLRISLALSYVSIIGFAVGCISFQQLPLKQQC